ncbi:MAG: carbonic anhydrase [Planctomycetota bacterium]|jgi:carbonic anhydrase
MDMKTIVENTAAFKKDVFPAHAGLFQELSNGQSPEVLLITCSDSRIQPHLLTGGQPGDLFVIRNAGNVASCGEDGTSGEAATIDYAVSVLGVKHIVVCGHSCCGAMQALCGGPENCGLPLVADWLSVIKRDFEKCKKEIAADDVNTVIEANVLVQLENLRRHPAVAKALAAGQVSLHGWVYRFESGDVLACDNNGRFEPLASDRHLASVTG